jgi:ferredoxin-type protein NapG
MVSAQRRRFLGELGKSACGAVLFGGGLIYVTEKSQPHAAWVIRPPGALAEENFLGACIRCGLCVRDCPYDTLDLARIEDEAAAGTPYFVARDVPCEMCDDIPCVKACPTGALDPKLTEIDDARMGLAVLIDEENCLNFQGLRCDVCYRVCPAIDEAITLDPDHNERTGRHTRFLPVVHSEACTGCGKCEYACVLEEAAIKVLPIALAKGELGHHYRWGWREKEKAGKSLVTPDKPHEYHLPEGLRYEHEGSGLVPAAPGTATPFSDSALDTLKRGMQQP